MRIILSRKGFDSSYGGYPSIIDGDKMYSMPIPAAEDYKYADLKTADGANLFDIMKAHYPYVYNEKGKRVKRSENMCCHPDPNLTNYFGADGFVGSIGQVDAAQGHLEANGIKEGDLFLFFGWFKEAKDGKFEKGNGRHVLFGYLQIGEKIYTHNLTAEERKSFEKKYPWLEKQPHWKAPYINNNSNCIYIASEKFADTDLKGCGTFSYSPELDLTRIDPATNEYDICRTHWNLPEELKGLNITYCPGESAEKGYFQAAARGQEFVIDYSKKAAEWAKNLVKQHIKHF